MCSLDIPLLKEEPFVVRTARPVGQASERYRKKSRGLVLGLREGRVMKFHPAIPGFIADFEFSSGQMEGYLKAVGSLLSWGFSFNLLYRRQEVWPY
jgi:hypothetical protein